MQVHKHAHEIAAKLVQKPENSLRDESFVIRGYLVLAIITGDIQFLIDLALNDWTADFKADVSDLFAMLIVIAKRIYLQNAPKKQAD
jgi:hypothetical protein